MRQSFSRSIVKERVRPSSPAKVTAIQKMPGAADCMAAEPGLRAKLKTSTTRKAKKHMADRRSLVRTSVFRSFQRTAAAW